MPALAIADRMAFLAAAMITGLLLLAAPPAASSEPVPLTVTPLAVENVTILTSPPNLTHTVNGTRAQSPQAYAWQNGSDYLLAVDSPQTAGSTRFVFARWSDGGAPEHTYHVSGPATLTAEFTTEYLVTISTTPLGMEFTVDGLLVTSPVSFWWGEGSRHEVLPSEMQYLTSGVRVSSFAWSDSILARRDLVVDGPKDLVGVFHVTSYSLTLEVPPFASAACSYALCWFESGTVATFYLTDWPGESNGTREDFRGWLLVPENTTLDGSVRMDSPKHVRATWATQHKLTVDAGPGHAAGEGWHDNGSVVSLSVDSTEVTREGSTWKFAGWQGSVNSPSPKVEIMMDRPQSVTATWNRIPLSILSSPAGISLVVILMGAAVAGSVALRTPRGEYALAGLAAPLFTRIRKTEVRNQYNRGRLMQFIEDHPGAGYAHLRRRLGLSNGACAYHLRVLERSGEIRRVVERTSVRFYPSDYKFDAEALPPLAYVQRRILEQLVARGSATLGQLQVSLSESGEDVTATNLGYHLNALSREKHLIETRREGRKAVYYIDGERREALRARLKAEYGVDEAMDVAVLSQAIRGGGREPPRDPVDEGGPARSPGPGRNRGEEQRRSGDGSAP